MSFTSGETRPDASSRVINSSADRNGDVNQRHSEKMPVFMSIVQYQGQSFQHVADCRLGGATGRHGETPTHVVWETTRNPPANVPHAPSRATFGDAASARYTQSYRKSVADPSRQDLLPWVGGSKAAIQRSKRNGRRRNAAASRSGLELMRPFMLFDWQNDASMSGHSDYDRGGALAAVPHATGNVRICRKRSRLMYLCRAPRQNIYA